MRLITWITENGKDIKCLNISATGKIGRKHSMIIAKNVHSGYYKFESFSLRKTLLSIQNNDVTKGKHCNSTNVMYVERDGYQEFFLNTGMFGLM